MQQTWEYGKNIISGPVLAHLAQDTQICFSKFWLRQLLDIMVSYHHTSEKTNDLILRKYSGGRTDRQTEERDFIGRCPTNVERPTPI